MKKVIVLGLVLAVLGSGAALFIIKQSDHLNSMNTPTSIAQSR